MNAFPENKRREVLLLNGSEEIITVVDWQRAVQLLMSEKAMAPYGYDHFYEIKTSAGVYKLPKAIMLTEYVHIPFRKVSLTKANLYKRDKGRCQYCGHKARRMTIDHIMPRSRGGENSWKNLVTCCHACNMKKGNKTPKEARMKLMSEPTVPQSRMEHVVHVDDHTQVAWERWLPKPEGV